LLEKGARRAGFFEHIFGKNAVSARRVVYKYMGHGADQLAVLDDRASAHSLHDAAGLAQELLVGDAQDHILALGAVAVIDPFNFGIKILGAAAVDGGQDFHGAGFHFLLHGGFEGRPLRGPGQPAINAGGHVRQQRADGRVVGKIAAQLTGSAFSALRDPVDGDGNDVAAQQGHQLSGVGVADAVAKAGKTTGGRIVIGQRADARGAVADPDARLIQPVGFGARGTDGKRTDGSVPAHGELQGLSPAAFHCLLHVGVFADGFSVDCGDDVADFQPGVYGRVDAAGIGLDVRKPHDDDAVCEHLDAERLAAEHDAGLVNHVDFDRL